MNLPHDKGVRLREINYKHYKNRGCLQGIRLIFTNGVKTPWFETENSKSNEELEVKSLVIDTRRQIRYISVNTKAKMSIRGLRLIDSQGESIVD